MDEGGPIDARGMLVRQGGGFALRADGGVLWRLELSRVPVDLVGKRARIIGRCRGTDLIEADGVQPD